MHGTLSVKSKLFSRTIQCFKILRRQHGMISKKISETSFYKAFIKEIKDWKEETV